MTSATKKILEEALALPEDERAALVSALNESLETAADDLSPEWKAEIARRIEAVERGESRLIPWDEVEARIRETLRRI
jgi:putative addiction module component (TIGR02574 family)